MNVPTTPPAVPDRSGGPRGGAPSRRGVLRGVATISAATALGVTDLRTAHATGLRTDPFALGVAAGDPLPDGLLLWTRLVRDPFDVTSLPDRDIPVGYEIAHDPRFRHLARRGSAVARARLAHSVHVDVDRLASGREYFYRFRAGSFVSPTGRARTAPAPRSHPDSLRFAIANCQDYQNGYWPAYAAMAEEDLDFVLHLGDYLYEYDPASAFPDRRHTAPATVGLDQLRTLSDYRARHAQYKLDPALQAAHARAAFIATWDDHEVENNYADDVDEIDDAGARFQPPRPFLLERSAAYQAYYEHMPIRVRYHPGSASLRLYRRFDFADLARFSVLDTRQYRTDQPGGSPGDFGAEAGGRANVAGTLTGDRQERWLRHNLRSTPARWNVLAQQVMMTRTRFPNPLPDVPLPFITNLDQWDGYAPFRSRVLGYLADGVPNPVVLSGDIHSTWMNDLVLDPDDAHGRPVASEFVSTSISSSFPIEFDAPIKQTLPVLNPRTRYFDGSRRGYLRVHVDRRRWLTEARTVDSIATRSSPVTTTARFAVEHRVPGVVPA